jgi:hypothetical protein
MENKNNERLAVLETKVEQIRADVAEVRLHQSENHHELATKIDKLTKHIDGKLNDHERRIVSAEETLEPFTKFRKRIWGAIVVAALTLAFISLVLLQLK